MASTLPWRLVRMSCLWAMELLEAHAAGASVGDGSYLPRLARAQKIADLADSYGLWNA